MRKRCAKCKHSKRIDEFGFDRRQRDGYAHYCKPCKRAADKESKAKRDPEKVRLIKQDQHLRATYGITLADYDLMYAIQQGRCAICSVCSDNLDVDHCHESGIVRGLLCRRCNLGLSWIETPGWLNHAYTYLGRLSHAVSASAFVTQYSRDGPENATRLLSRTSPR
jgi:hypothetical protein